MSCFGDFVGAYGICLGVFDVFLRFLCFSEDLACHWPYYLVLLGIFSTFFETNSKSDPPFCGF